MFKKVIDAFKNKEIRSRILFTLGIIFIYKLGTTITVPRCQTLDFSSSTLGYAYLMDLMNGGSLQQFSIFALGVSPYITASIVTEILSSDNMLPALSELKKQGEQGRKKIESINRYLSLLFCVIQGWGLLTTLGIKDQLNLASEIYVVTVITAGSMLLVWFADQISSKGVGNGVSVIIFAGIVMSIPEQLKSVYLMFLPSGLVNNEVFIGILKFGIYLIGYIAVIAFVVFMENSIRKIPLQYSANTTQINMKKDITFLPIKINSSGVLPVIYANSLMMAVIMIVSFFTEHTHAITHILSVGDKYKGVYWGIIIYTVLIILFSYYQSNMQINPEETAENLTKSNAYIPGIRPGKETKAHISRVLNRVNFIGMLGLLFVAILPSILTILFNLPQSVAFGGTGLIIVVGVVAEINAQISSKLNTREYSRFSY